MVPLEQEAEQALQAVHSFQAPSTGGRLIKAHEREGVNVGHKDKTNLQGTGIKMQSKMLLPFH